MSLRTRRTATTASLASLLLASGLAHGQAAGPTPPAADAPAAPPPAVAPATPPAATAPAAPPAATAPAAPPAATAPPAAAAPAAPPAAAPAPSEPKRAEHTLGLEVGGGLSTRLNDSSTGMPLDERNGLLLRAGVAWGPSRLLSVGVHYFHQGIGTEFLSEEKSDAGGRTRRSLDGALLELRLFPVRGQNARLFVALQGSLAFESLDKQGTFVNSAGISPVVYSFKCKASGGGGFGLGASLGADIDVSDNTAFIVRTSAVSHRLPSSVLMDGDQPCAFGSGSTSLFEAQLGFQVRFDLGSSGGAQARAQAAAPAGSGAW